MDFQDQIKESVEKVRERIYKAVQKSGRGTDSVRLMAVSKFHSEQEIQCAVNEGITLFGENRVQEAELKFPSILEKNPGIELHMIGSLQRNKVKTIIKLVSCIQSVDRLELLSEIQKSAAIKTKSVDILLEVHTGEESKSGFIDEDAVFRALEYLESIKNTAVVPKGFMTMAPFTTDEKAVRASFRKLCEVQKHAQQRFPNLSLTELSMGMSNDFEIAVEEGSTLVRVGTAIFGRRE